MKSYLTELIGTFFLVLIIGLSVSTGSDLAPIAIGVGLTALVYMGGHISGAHYNPAVSLAILMRGAIGARDAAIYMVVQVAGAILAALATKFLVGASITVGPGPMASTAQVLLAEFLFTFVLAFVILNVATSKDHPNNSFYGVAIGLTVMSGAFCVGGLSGGAFNPAVALGPNIVTGALGNIWIYLVACFAGGAVAAIAFKVCNPHEFE